MGDVEQPDPDVSEALARLLAWPDIARSAQLAGWDLDRGAVSKIEAGLRRVYDTEVWHLARLLKCELAALYPGVGDMKTRIPPTQAKRR